MLTCIFENGDKASLRHGTVDALVIKQNKILLVKRASHLSNPNKYALPGGFIDRNETIIQAIQRELREETGYESNLEQLFRIIDNPKRQGENRQNIDFVFLITPGDKRSNPDSENSECAWFSFGKLPPEKDFAFDHFETISLYLQYKNKKTSLPLIFQ